MGVAEIEASANYSLHQITLCVDWCLVTRTRSRSLGSHLVVEKVAWESMMMHCLTPPAQCCESVMCLLADRLVGESY